MEPSGNASGNSTGRTKVFRFAGKRLKLFIPQDRGGLNWSKIRNPSRSDFADRPRGSPRHSANPRPGRIGSEKSTGKEPGRVSLSGVNYLGRTGPDRTNSRSRRSVFRQRAIHLNSSARAYEDIARSLSRLQQLTSLPEQSLQPQPLGTNETGNVRQ